MEGTYPSYFLHKYLLLSLNVYKKMTKNILTILNKIQKILYSTFWVQHNSSVIHNKNVMVENRLSAEKKLFAIF